MTTIESVNFLENSIKHVFLRMFLRAYSREPPDIGSHFYRIDIVYQLHEEIKEIMSALNLEKYCPSCTIVYVLKQKTNEHVYGTQS